MDSKRQNPVPACGVPAGGPVKKLLTSPWTQVLVLLTAAAFLTLGITRGEVAEVFKKAIKICLECIGIG